MPDDPLAELLEARLAVCSVERHLEQLERDSLDRPAVEAALVRARERHARAVRAQEEAVAARRGRNEP
jgi:hypothetical protein